MFKFNNNNITTGYIKQVLKDTELPAYKIYSNDNLRYLQSEDYKKTGIEKNIVPSLKLADTFKSFMPYLKNGRLQIYKATKLANNNYSYSWEDLNFSSGSALNSNINNKKTFYIKNNIYDSYTHIQLGNYLRYIRDNYNINLLSLYNCFSNSMPSLIDCSFTLNNGTENIKKIFKSADKAYKIYMVPVKYLTKYTIAIDSSYPVEMCCGFYNTRFLESSDIIDVENFWAATYKKYNSMHFGTPIIYDKLVWDNIAEKFLLSSKPSIQQSLNYVNIEDDLKLFIKISAAANTSISILEGEFLNYNDRQYIFNKKIRHKKYVPEKKEYIIEETTLGIPAQEINHFVVNFDGYKERLENNTDIFKPITFLQLLAQNTGESYPFADRLIEYLSGNVITSKDDLEDNIKRIQNVVAKNNINISGSNMNTYGLWDDLIRPIMYSYMINSNLTSDIGHDLLGYIDKDTEESYKSTHIVTDLDSIAIGSKYFRLNVNTVATTDTLKHTDIYENIYKAAKVKTNK